MKNYVINLECHINYRTKDSLVEWGCSKVLNMEEVAQNNAEHCHLYPQQMFNQTHFWRRLPMMIQRE